MSAPNARHDTDLGQRGDALISAGHTVLIGDREVGPGRAAYVIAEIGVNHEGDPATCARMIEEAAHAGADAIKLQTIDPEENYAPGTPSYRIFSEARLDDEDTARLFGYARDLGVDALTTAGDLDTLRFVSGLAPVAHKISSGLLTHLPLIAEAARTERPVILSTGMADIDDIQAAVTTAEDAGAVGVILLQCTSLYPAPPPTLNLRAIGTLAQRFAVPVGFSDHSLGTEAPALAVAAGACVIEKHFTLDAGREGFDHAVSLEPSDFAVMVASVRRAERMLGDGAKEPTPEERELADRYRRKIVARTDLQEGSILTLDAVGFMRLPEGSRGLPASGWKQLEGRRLLRSLGRLEAIELDDTAPPGGAS